MVMVVLLFLLPLTTMSNENQYFDVLSTDKWEWLDIFSWIYKYTFEPWQAGGRANVCLFTSFREIWA